MKTLGTTLLILQALCLQAQLPTGRSGDGARSFMNQFVIADQAMRTSEPEKVYHGTPYLLNKWTPCDIVGIKGQVFRDIQVKYNLYQKHLLYRPLHSRDSVFVRDELIKSFTVKSEDSIYLFEKFLMPLKYQTDRMEEFFIVLDSGQYTLLAQPTKRLQESTSNALTKASTDQLRRYVDDVEFYIRRPDRTVLPVKGPRKQRASIFGEDYQQVLQFAKSNRLNWKDRSDLENIIEYANNGL